MSKKCRFNWKWSNYTVYAFIQCTIILKPSKQLSNWEKIKRQPTCVCQQNCTLNSCEDVKVVRNKHLQFLCFFLWSGLDRINVCGCHEHIRPGKHLVSGAQVSATMPSRSFPSEWVASQAGQAPQSEQQKPRQPPNESQTQNDSQSEALQKLKEGSLPKPSSCKLWSIIDILVLGTRFEASIDGEFTWQRHQNPQSTNCSNLQRKQTLGEHTDRYIITAKRGPSLTPRWSILPFDFKPRSLTVFPDRTKIGQQLAGALHWLPSCTHLYFLVLPKQKIRSSSRSSTIVVKGLFLPFHRWRVHLRDSHIVYLSITVLPGRVW